MQNNNKHTIYIISDAIGITGMGILQAVIVQFPQVQFEIKRFPFITNSELLDKVLASAKKDKAFLVFTFIKENLTNKIILFCQKNNLEYFNAINNLLTKLTKITKQKPIMKIGINHETNKNYFKKIEALEFAIKYDDGKNIDGISKTDILLLGVSRTSKTPLSIYLANLGYKVANIPLMPQAQVPKEIFKIDKNKIFGLTNDPQILNNIRKERMLAYGLNPNTKYSDINNIKKELRFAEQLYQKIQCSVINVAHKSIEETATIILETLTSKKQNKISDEKVFE